nr:unnamed protein product [Callosobruchus chinensis]
MGSCHPYYLVYT